ncbi:unnamed protein product [Blepharisma stoltei]|uniref:Receptor ligand binding region domain-containing protein n=1 Tax=Blepharisma stoltei TaxID=1481888 RepID=A0AAU9JMK3_9CILI|nr:unnamed protein product [Blepharisma stoltei]
MTQDIVDSIISKDLKASGIARIFILADPENCIKIQKSLIAFNMNKSGYAILLGHSCLNNGIIDGSLMVLPSYDINSISEKESYINSLSYFINEFSRIKVQNKSLFLQKYRDLTENLLFNFTVMNIRNKIAVKIGEISNFGLEIKNEIQFPGEISTMPESSISIWISGNIGSFNPFGHCSSIVNQLYNQGSEFAVYKINESKTILPNFILRLNNQINCGATVWNYEFAKACYLENKNNLGVAYLTSYLSSVAVATLNLFKELNISIPVVNGVNSAKVLSSTKLYPTYTRMVINTDYMGKTWVIYMRAMGWTKCVVLYADDAYDLSVYDIFLQVSRFAGITILNKEQYRKFPYSYNVSQLENYRKNFQNAIDQNCNIFFIFFTDPVHLYVLNSLYEMGLRKGDGVFLLSSLSGSDFLYAASDIDIRKTSELLSGVLFLFVSEWVGSFGKELQQEYIERYPKYGTRMRCTHFDAVLAIAEAIKMLLSLGKNYENYQTLNWAIKNLKFKGCSGRVIIENDSNDRRLDTYSLNNVFLDNSTNTWKTVDAGYFAPDSGTFFKLTRKIVWPTGEEIPPNMKSFDCPFRSSQIQNSTKSRGIKAGICAFISIFSIIFAVFNWKKYFSYKLEMISREKYFTEPDYWVLTTIIIESLQFQGIGPSFYAFNQLLYEVVSSSSYNIESLIKGDIFWKFFYSTLVFCIGWLFMNFSIYLELSNHFEKIGIGWMFQAIEKSEKIVTPLIINIFFQPMITMLISIIQCDYSTSLELESAFLNYDCYSSCWNSEYLSITIPTLLILVLYILLAIQARPSWQEGQINLNIKSDPACIMIKSALQVTLIGIYKTLRIISQILHCSVYLFLIACYLIFIIHRKNFNYDRANLLQIFCIICVFWNGSLSLVYLILNSGHYSIYLSIQLFGLLIIIVCSLIIMRKLPPSLLIKKEGKKISNLFRFSLMNGSLSNSSCHLSMQKEYENLYYSNYKEALGDSSKIIESAMPISLRSSPELVYISDIQDLFEENSGGVELS